jgi:hypothetical protein
VADATEPKTDDAQSFASFLCTHARGRSERELSEKLRDLVQAVEETGKGGSITYKLSIKPQANAEHAVLVQDDITVKTPTLDRPASIFFADEAYRLVRSDPRQMTIDSLIPQERS